MTDRSNLPFRETTDAVLIYDGKILGLDKGHYVQFAGGGVDPGETPEQAVRREIIEETGCKVSDLKLISTTDSLWWRGWTEGKPKREERYKQFQGERTHIFVGFIKSFGKPTSNEGDAWPLPIKKHLMPIDKIEKMIEKNLEKTHPNFLCYNSSQLSIVRMVKYFKNTLKK